MVAISEVRFSDITIDDRLEASYYHPIRMETIEKLRKLGKDITLLGSLSKVKRKLLDPRNHYNDKFLYFELKNVPKGGFGAFFYTVVGKNLDSSKFVFNRKNILFSKIRTYLNKVVIISEYIKEGICSTEFIVLEVNESKIDPFVLWVYLVSKFGYNQVRFIGIGSTRPRANTSDILNIRVPLFSDDFMRNIREIVSNALKTLYESEKKYQHAEELLYKLLGISKEEIEKLEEEKGYETNFKNVAEAFRFDAEYYHPKYLGVIELLEKIPFEIKPLKNVVEILDKKIDPTNEKNKTKRFRYVPIAKINESGEIFEWDEFYGWQAPSRARKLIKEKDIIIPSLAGTFDKIALVPRELDGQLTTTGCFVVKVKEDYPEFLFLLLRTPLFKRQLEQQTTGAIMSAVPKSVFGDLSILKIPKEEQKEIAKLVRGYLELRKEARELIRQAIMGVEEEIENASNTGDVGEQ